VRTPGTWERGRPPQARRAPAIARVLETDEDEVMDRIVRAHRGASIRRQQRHDRRMPSRRP
jgi:hypothetical protein